MGQISRANDNSFVKIADLPVDKMEDAKSYDMIFVNGMGLRITEEQRQLLLDAAESGTPVLTTAVTNPQNLIVSVDSVDETFLKQYLAGGRENYRNMLKYVRKFIDGKSIKAEMPGDPVAWTSSLLYLYRPCAITSLSNARVTPIRKSRYFISRDRDRIHLWPKEWKLHRRSIIC